MSDVMQEKKDDKRGRGLQSYYVFRKQENNMWEEIGSYQSPGTADAKKQAVEDHNLHDEIRRGEVTLVAVGKRLWNPATPKAEPQPDKLIW